MNDREKRLAEALQALIDLHWDWDSGSAYVSVSFKEKNDKAIKEARAAIASHGVIGGSLESDENEPW